MVFGLQHPAGDLCACGVFGVVVVGVMERPPIVSAVFFGEGWKGEGKKAKYGGLSTAQFTMRL